VIPLFASQLSGITTHDVQPVVKVRARAPPVPYGVGATGIDDDDVDDDDVDDDDDDD